jgi:hypothetical protein
MQSLKDKLKQDSEVYGMGGNKNFFTFENKKTSRIKILTEPEVLAQHFFGKGAKPSVCYGKDKGCPFHNADEKVSVKYVCYVLDVTDNNTIKIADLPYTVVKSLSELQADEDFTFESYPVPYDIKVTFDKDQAPNDMYKIIGGAVRYELNSDLMNLFNQKVQKSPIATHISNKKIAQIQEHQEKGIWKSPETIAKEAETHKQDYREKAMAYNEKMKNEKLEDEIEYPTEEINVEDIPF